MKKTPRKLLLRSETLRMLANMDLERAVGGGDTGTQQCPAILDTERVNCPTDVVATAVCG